MDRTRAGCIGVLLAWASISNTAFGETVLITGSNSGIGLEFAKQYAALGWDVIATHRRDEIPESLRIVAAQFDKLRV